MILKNKRTREPLNITLLKLKIHFAKTIKIAFESYMRTELVKLSFQIKDVKESDFYFDLRWKFNHLACTDWYIEQL